MRRRQALIEADKQRIEQPKQDEIQEPPRYKCRFCTRDFESQTGMYIHISRLHTDAWKRMKERGEV